MAYRHGRSGQRRGGRRSRPTPEYVAYAAMKNRVLNKRAPRYKDYGGRGITICDRWLYGAGGYPGFLCFLWDVGEKPGPEYSLDRYPDNDGNYEPGNVRWATQSQQVRNTRLTHYVDVCGVELPLIDVASRWGAASYPTIRMRLSRGWQIDAAIFVPVGGKPGDAVREVPF